MDGQVPVSSVDKRENGVRNRVTLYEEAPAAAKRMHLARVEGTVNHVAVLVSRIRTALIQEAIRLKNEGFTTDAAALRAVAKEFSQSRENLDEVMGTMGLPR